MNERTTLFCMRDRAQFLQRLAFAFRRGQIERAIEPDILRNRRVDQRVEALVADRLSISRDRACDSGRCAGAGNASKRSFSGVSGWFRASRD